MQNSIYFLYKIPSFWSLAVNKDILEQVTAVE